MKKFSLLLSSLAVMAVLLLATACSSSSGSDTKPVAGISNLVAARTGMTEVVLTWDTVAQAVSYNISKVGYNVPFIDDTTSNSYTVTGLNKDTKYTFCVEAFDNAGLLIASGSVIVTTALLASPENITVVCNSNDNTVKISWDTIISYNQDYKIYRSDTADGEYVLIGTVSCYSSSYTDTGIADGLLHFYKVAVLKNDGSEHARSSPVRAQMGTDTTPNDLKVSMTPSRATLTWAPVNGAVSYIVEVYAVGLFASDEVENTFTVSADKTSYTVIGLKPKTKKLFKVYSMAPTKSIPAEVQDSTTDLEVTTLEQTAQTDSSISFTWTSTSTDAVADGVVFDVYRSDDSAAYGKGTLIAENQTGTSYVDTAATLTKGSCYYYSVIPKVSGSDTTYYGKVRVEFHTNPFSAPTNVKVNGTPGRTTLSVSWDGVPDASITSSSANYYKVFYAPHGSTELDWTIARTTSVVLDYLTSGTVYDVKVCVANSNMASDSSEIAQMTTKAPLAAMGAITLSEESAARADKTTIRVSWTSVPEAGSYKVYYHVFAGEYYKLGYTTTSSSETSTALTLNAGNRYEIYVKAIAADDANATSSSAEKPIQSAKTVSESVILASAVVYSGTTEIIDLIDSRTWEQNGGLYSFIPHSTSSQYKIGILNLNTGTSKLTYYFKMSMLPAMLASAPEFIMFDTYSSYIKDLDGNGVKESFGGLATMYAVSPNDLSSKSQISCPWLTSTMEPRDAGAAITSDMVYNNTLYLRMDATKGTVGVSAYY